MDGCTYIYVCTYVRIICFACNVCNVKMYVMYVIYVMYVMYVMAPTPSTIISCPKYSEKKQINNPLTLFGLKEPTPSQKADKIRKKNNMCHCLNFWGYSVHLLTPGVLRSNFWVSTAPKLRPGGRKRSAPRAVQQPSRRPAGPVCRGDSACHRPWCSPWGPRTRTRHRRPRRKNSFYGFDGKKGKSNLKSKFWWSFGVSDVHLRLRCGGSKEGMVGVCLM